MKNSKLIELKEEQKSLAKRIREQKEEVKNTQRSGSFAWQHQALLLKMQREYRHKHIAYSMLLGRTMEQIEPKVREHNEPSMATVKRLMDQYKPEVSL